METVTLIMIIGLTMFFLLSLYKPRLELCILAMLFVFMAFIAVSKDATLSADTIMLYYAPIVAIGLFEVPQFWRSKA